MTTNDGGPAFPTDNERQTGADSYHFTGMSLRDYFAAKAPNMDVVDICNVMDWDAAMPVGDPGDDETIAPDDTIWTRWRELTLYQRLAADAKYRYAWADAMLAARDAEADSIRDGGGPC